MPTLKLTFPGGRYHATPTGHHVNEGLVEWPPSPWRVLRALIATGYTTEGWSALPPEACALFDQLASVLPEYRLPPAALGHSRHYMPTGRLDKGRESTSLVFDAFADIGDGELWIRWPAVLGTSGQALFAKLASNLGYLGRSESWALAEAVSDEAPLPARGRAFPHTAEDGPRRGYEQVFAVAPEEPARFAAWRAAEVEAAREALANADKKPTKKALQTLEEELSAAYPVDFLDAMQWDTARWKAAGWSHAPGSRRVLYWRPSAALEVAPLQRRRPTRVGAVEVVLFALTTPSGSRSALPTIARTVPQADLLHRALVSRAGHSSTDVPELSGRSEDGTPLKNHRHAHVLPLDLDADGHLDHILLYVPQRLSAQALRAALSVKRTYTKGGVGELQLAVAGRGCVEELRKLDGELGRSIGALLGPSRRWISATPFVPPRFLKKRGRHTLDGQVLAELSVRGFPSARVEVIPWSAENAHLRHVLRHRSKERAAPQPPIDAGFILRLEFDDLVPGPICLGYGSHFGLGRFAIADSTLR